MPFATHARRFWPALPAWQGARMAGLMLVLLLAAAGWWAIAAQHRLLWQRVPPSAMERFAADQVAVALPSQPGVRQLASLCTTPPAWPVMAWRKWLRQAVAQCASAPQLLLQGAAAESASQAFNAQVQAQVLAAKAWLADWDAHAAQHRQALASQLASAGQLPAAKALDAAGDLGLRAVALLGIDAPRSLREPVGRREDAGRSAQGIRERLASTELRLAAAAKLPPGERARALALMATGLRLGADYGVYPPAPVLEADRSSLSEALPGLRAA